MIRYSVTMEDPNSHYYEVAIDILDFRQKLGSNPIRLVMPTWTPGSYLIREFSRNVLDLVAFDIDEDKKLNSRKVSKNVWEIDPDDSTGVRVKYRVFAFDFTVDTSYLDNVHGIINGASVFMYVQGFEHEESRLTLAPDPQWKVISTGLQVANEEGEGAETFLVPNFDVLVDSPIEVGNQDVYFFDLNGVKHEVSIFSQREFDQEEFVADLKRVVQTTVDVFSEIPYSRYVFIVDFVGDNYGGLEHLNSTHCIAPIYRLEPLQEYHQLMSLFSHEFFHAWNVKRMRPAGLGPFDYSRETYTRSLWIAEGITSYYDDLIVRRAGIYTVAEYLDAFCANINLMKSLPGSRWQSAEESSFDTWIKHYRQDENSPNVLSSYYVQGSVIGWMLDLQIMKSSEMSENLDRVLRGFYKRTFVEENSGYTDQEFEIILREFLGPGKVREIFDSRVRGRDDVDFDRYLSYCGLKLGPKRPQAEQGFLGVRTRQDSGKLLVSSVLSNSPAESAGLSVFDEIIAIDGIRMDGSKLSWYIANREPESQVKITVSRFGALQELSSEVAYKPVMEYRIFKKEQASDEERKLFKGWLREDWEAELKYEDYQPAPSKKNNFDYV